MKAVQEILSIRHEFMEIRPPTIAPILCVLPSDELCDVHVYLWLSLRASEVPGDCTLELETSIVRVRVATLSLACFPLYDNY